MVHINTRSSPLSSKICNSNKLNELKYKDQHSELTTPRLKYPWWDKTIFLHLTIILMT
jgi:hypothetical protein